MRVDFSLYAAKCDDFTTNGLAVLTPISATVEEIAGGSYECELVLPMTDDRRWQLAQVGCIVRLPTPTLATPQISLLHAEIPGNNEKGLAVWKAGPAWITVNGKVIRAQVAVRTGIAGNGRIIDHLAEGEECVQTAEAIGNYLPVSTQAGVSGYVRADLVSFVRYIKNEPDKPAWREVIKARKSRSQLFRIYSTEESDDGTELTVRGRHVFYDLLFNAAPKYDSGGAKFAVEVLEEINAALLNKDHGFRFYCNGRAKREYKFENKNMVEMLLESENGIMRKTLTELYRDNFDVFLLRKVGRDRGVTLRYGKNLVGVGLSVDDSDVVTRLCPYGQDADGNPIYLDGKYIDSKRIGEYPFPRIKCWNVSSAKIGGKHPDNKDVTLDEAGVKQLLKTEADKELERGCDQPDLEMTVHFQDLGGTEEYKEYADLQYIYLYDRVTVIHEPRGIKTTAQVTGYTWDCLSGYYLEIVLGNADAVKAGISVSGANIAGGTIGAGKLGVGAVNSSALAELSVLNAAIGNAAITGAKIANAAIQNAHIQDASIERGKIKDFEAEVAKIAAAEIKVAKIGTAQIEQLQAAVAEIVNASIRNAEISTAQIAELNAKVAELIRANIGVATIEELAAEIARLAKAEISKAHISTAQVEDLTAEISRLAQAEIGNAVIKTAQIENLQKVINANIKNASIGAAQIRELESVILANIRNAVIDYAKVRDIAADHALIRKGTAGEYFIDRLTVTAAQMVDLTVGKLCVKAADGNYYNLTVNIETGTVSAEKATVSAEEAAAGQTAQGKHIIETTIAAESLNATTVHAAEGLISRLTAERVDVDQLFAREATIAKINALDLLGNGSIRLVVDEQQSALEQKADAADVEAMRRGVLQQTADALTIRFQQAMDATDAVNQQLLKVMQDLGLYFRFAEDGLWIGRQGSDFKTRITDERLSFLQGLTEVAYISNRTMHITDAEITQTLRVGNLQGVVEPSGAIAWNMVGGE